MTIERPFDSVLELFRGSDESAIVVAPYIKSRTLQRLLTVVPPTARDFVCVTRWLPEDLATGVCDAEILEDVKRHPGGKLLVHPHLHAKYYRAGGSCIVGSANLTGRGLGLVAPPNVELLIEVPASFPGLRAWEERVLDRSIEADEDLRDQMVKEADNIRKDSKALGNAEVDWESDSALQTLTWIPSCPVPDRLWEVYSGGGAATMVTSARKAAEGDLAALGVPAGLSSRVFARYVAGILKQMPVIVEIDLQARSGIADSAAREILGSMLGITNFEDAVRAWRTLKAWLVYFFAETYRVEAGQEVLLRGKELSL